METKRVVSSVLLGLTFVASPAFASESGSVNIKPAKVGVFGFGSGKRMTKRAAKAELKAFLAANPSARGKERFAPALVRTGGLLVSTAALPLSWGVGFAAAMSGRPQTASYVLLGTAVAAPVVAFKLARAVARNTNTMAVNRAIDAGAEVSPVQLERWSAAGLIRVDAQ